MPDKVTHSGTMTTTRYAWRYGCLHASNPLAGLRHDSGDGKPPRQRCRGCGGELWTERGRHGVFLWRGDGRYQDKDAVPGGIFTVLGRAHALADRLTDDPEAHGVPVNDGGYVVKWLPAPEGGERDDDDGDRPRRDGDSVPDARGAVAGALGDDRGHERPLVPGVPAG